MEKIISMLSDEELKIVVFKRYCKKCKELKDISEYQKIIRKKETYYKHRCNDCIIVDRKKYNKDYYKRKKEKLKKKLNISSSEEILTDDDKTLNVYDGETR